MTYKKADAMYVHIPFCKSICSYCDFTKLIYLPEYEEKYLKALFDEVKQMDPNKCRTIYLGGGTPSVLSSLNLEKVLNFFKNYLEDDYEFTIEVNPETIDEEKIKLFSKYGINRVSVGVESFSDDVLSFLKRKHTKDDVIKLVELLNKYNLTNYSFDFIYGINGFSNHYIEVDLKYIDLLKPKHVSFYSLILEEHTCLRINDYQELDEDDVSDQYEFIVSELSKRGYHQYEVSNYCLPGYESKHNLVYWKDDKYYGFGLGASGYLDNYRYTNTKNFTKYISFNYKKDIQELSIDEMKEEYLMLGLRLNEGISLQEYNERFHSDLKKEKQTEIEELLKKDLIKISDGRLFTTATGMLLLNMVILKLI